MQLFTGEVKTGLKILWQNSELLITLFLLKLGEEFESLIRNSIQSTIRKVNNVCHNWKVNTESPLITAAIKAWAAVSVRAGVTAAFDFAGRKICRALRRDAGALANRHSPPIPRFKSPSLSIFHVIGLSSNSEASECDGRTI
jgi:hypothetical protein